MPKQPTPTARYVVANPRGLPGGAHILSVTRGHATERFYEGDTIEPSDAFSPQGWAAWLAGGFVVEVTG